MGMSLGSEAARGVHRGGFDELLGRLQGWAAVNFGTTEVTPSTAATVAVTAEEEEAAQAFEHCGAVEAEAEVQHLRAEVLACEQALLSPPTDGDQLPAWAHRCTWRDELDVRAGQLERISLQFDATKRSLDAANEELQWQARSAEDLRMRLAVVLQAIQTEDRKTEELRAEHQQSEGAVQELVEKLRSVGKDITNLVPEHVRTTVMLGHSLSKADTAKVDPNDVATPGNVAQN